MLKFLLALTIIFSILVSCSAHEKEDEEVTKGDSQIVLTSDGFKNNELMPDRYSYRNNNISPYLAWEKIPVNTKSFVIICDDPDAPVGTWVHWVIANIPSSDTCISEAVPKVNTLDNEAIQGVNDYGEIGYGGPAPPSGVHRYFFKIYALDTVLQLPNGFTKKDALSAMENHILGYGELIGRYAHK